MNCAKRSFAEHEEELAPGYVKRTANPPTAPSEGAVRPLVDSISLHPICNESATAFVIKQDRCGKAISPRCAAAENEKSRNFPSRGDKGPPGMGNIGEALK